MDIKQRLRQLAESEAKANTWMERRLIQLLCRDALAEIERQQEVIRTLQVELDIARSAARDALPEVHQLTRHTITLQTPLPAMDVGDSLLLVIVPPR